MLEIRLRFAICFILLVTFISLFTLIVWFNTNKHRFLAYMLMLVSNYISFVVAQYTLSWFRIYLPQLIINFISLFQF